MDTEKLLNQLTRLSARRTALEAEIDGLVGMCRAEEFTYDSVNKRWHAEVSWQEIGDALGISRQAAHQLYRRRWSAS
jgi:hypothetical protein